MDILNCAELITGKPLLGYEKDFITQLEKASQIMIPRHNGRIQIESEMKKLERIL